MIWKRKHKCSVCKTDLFFDDKKQKMYCQCGEFTTKMLQDEIIQHMLKVKFDPTILKSVRIVGKN